MVKKDDKFTPCPIADGDELFPNGIFVFNSQKAYVASVAYWNDKLKQKAIMDLAACQNNSRRSKQDQADIEKLENEKNR